MVADQEYQERVNRIERYEYRDVKAPQKSLKCYPGSVYVNRELTGLDEASLERYFKDIFPGSCRGSGTGDSSDAMASVDPASESAGFAEPNDSTHEEVPTAGLRVSTVIEECAKAEDSGFRRGFEEGLKAGRGEGQQHWLDERKDLHRKLESLVGSFETARQSFFERLEVETVELAIAIAERVLYREAGIDPLLLTNAVRVALRQLAKSTRVSLRIPACDQAVWEENLALFPSMKTFPAIIPDASMSTGDCRVETELGTAELGLEFQLNEIRKELLNKSERRGTTSFREDGSVAEPKQVDELRAKQSPAQDEVNHTSVLNIPLSEKKFKERL